MRIKRLIKIGLVIFPMIALLVMTNITVDPGNVAQQSLPDEMADSLLVGHDTYVVSGNMDERATKLAILKKIDKPYECIALGPSLIMCVSREMVGTDSFQNFGVSGANNMDVFGMFYSLVEKDLPPKRVILCVDTTMFDEDRLLRDQRSLTWSARYDAAKRLFATGELTIKQADAGESKWRKYYSATSSLFSIAYFQAALQYRSTNEIQSQKIGVVDTSFTGAYWRADGSHVYAQSFQNQTTEEVHQSIQEYVEANFDKIIGKNQHLSDSAIQLFEDFVQYCKDSQIDLDLFLCPYPQELWNEIQSDPKWTLPRELDAYINEYANEHDLTVIGSYNPYEVGCTTADFYDNRHLRAESLTKFFDFHAEADHVQ